MQRKADRTFDCHPAGVRDLDPSDLDRPAATCHCRAFCGDKSVAHQVKQFRREPRLEDRISAAALSCIGKQF
jgi:hypothetical protein